MLDVSVALERLLDHFTPVGTETINLEIAYHRVLAEDITAGIDLPMFDNSSMDGFAVRSLDTIGADNQSPIYLTIVDDIPAGKVPTIDIGSKQAARIMTGAPIPPGADAVVPLEFTDHFGVTDPIPDKTARTVGIMTSVEKGAYIRLAGSDVRRGSTVLESGICLRPQEIGLLAMLGRSYLQVFRHPRVALISTGDELIPVEETLRTGKIHDSNAYTLAGLINRDGGEAIYHGIVPDEEGILFDALEAVVDQDVDLIISTAGVSVGAFDLVKMVVEKRGKLDFWRVNMRPGKPLTFGNFMNVPFIGLPGNPVSAFVGYEVFVRPALLKLAGRSNLTRRRYKVITDEPLESDGRESYLRAVIRFSDHDWHASLTGHQGSGNLLSLVQANALLIMPSGVKSLPSGSEVDAWILDDGLS